MSTEEVIASYKEMQESNPNSTILREVRWQYAAMAEGGDGGRLYFKPHGWSGTHPDGPTCREFNYPGKPDSFFQEVINALGW